MGHLVPILCKEVLPGDRWRGKVDIFLRYQPLFAPVMHKVNVFTHFFYVPTRVLWNYSQEDSFETFMTGGRQGKLKPIPPFFRLTDVDSIQDNSKLVSFSSLADYLNVNVQHCTGVELYGLEFSQLPFRAYQSICDEYYRNKNLQDSYYNELSGLHRGGFHAPTDIAEFESETVPRDVTFESLFSLRRRLWEDDYFTSALPTPERGDPVNIPFATSSSFLDVVSRDGMRQPALIRNASTDSLANPLLVGNGFGQLSNGVISKVTTDLFDADGRSIEDADGHTVGVVTDVNHTAGSGRYYFDPNGTLFASTSGVRNAATIRDLRIATLAERFQEISMNTLPDYRHFVNAFFDVVVPDYRLQLPELVGGGRQPVAFSEVTQMSATVESDSESQTSPLGKLGGHGVSVPFAAQDGHNFDFFAPEHGYLIGIMSVMPKTAYAQGLPRMYSRLDRFDYYMPLFETLPFQEVLNKELYYRPGDPNTGFDPANNETFGYQPRFSEYKWDEDEIHGDLKGSLNYWTMARMWNKTDTPPVLNVDFVTSNPTTRIFNSTNDDVDKLIALCDFSVVLDSRMSKYTKI